MINSAYANVEIESCDWYFVRYVASSYRQVPKTLLCNTLPLYKHWQWVLLAKLLSCHCTVNDTDYLNSLYILWRYEDSVDNTVEENSSIFSLIHTCWLLSAGACEQYNFLPTKSSSSACRCCSNHSISPAHSSKPAAVGLLLWALGGTDGRTQYHFINPALHNVRQFHWMYTHTPV